MNPEALATVILAILGMVGLIGAGVAWFYKRGGQEREFSIALRANTTATNELTKRFDVFMERTLIKQENTDARVNDHETRITVNERDIRELRKVEHP